VSEVSEHRLQMTSEVGPACQHIRRLEAGGLIPMTEQKSPRSLLHIAAPHWSIKKQSCNVIV
jgi:hypothetical protein